MYKNFLLLSVLNLLDGWFTFIGLEMQVIDEMNPLMETAWKASPLFFLGIKTAFSLVTWGTAVFIKKKNYTNKIGTVVTTLVCVVYLVVMAMHMFWVYKIM